MTFRLIEQEKAHHAVCQLCRVLGGSRAGFSAWQSRPPSARAVADQQLTEQLRAIHARSRATYGAPGIHAELRLDHGVHVGRKRVARLLGAAGLTGCSRRRRRGLTRRDPQAAPAPDLVNRSLVAPAPNRVWTADITSLSTWSGWLDLAIVVDVDSRRVVGWAMADHLRTELVIDALDMAIWNRRPNPGLVHHSDQGCQDTSLAFGRRLREGGLVASMGTVGDGFDNAVTESFFATLEWVLLDRHRFRTRTQARLAVFDYLEGCYNSHRRHAALGQLSPSNFERSHQPAYAAAQPRPVHQTGSTPLELAALGIADRHSRAYHPQTCGKVERLHQTLKRWLASQPTAATVVELQAQLDRFADYDNTQRPHRALGRRAPVAAYAARPTATPSPPGVAVPGHYRIRRDKVDHRGVITLRYNSRLHHIGLGRRHTGVRVLVLVADLDVRVLTEDGQLLRALTLDPSRDYQPQHKP